MIFCDFDWKAVIPLLASLIASGTALYISRKWSNQKGSEVIADEAKDVVFDIKELDKLLRELISNTNKFSSGEDFNNLKISLRKLCYENSNRLNFISTCISDTKKLNIIDRYAIILSQIDSSLNAISMEEYEVLNKFELLENLGSEDEVRDILGGLHHLNIVAKEIATYRFKLKKESI